jgi:hypothetical protein
MNANRAAQFTGRVLAGTAGSPAIVLAGPGQPDGAVTT